MRASPPEPSGSAAGVRPRPRERPADLRRRIGLLLGPLAALLVVVSGAGLPWPERALAGIVVLVVVFWVTEPLPIPITGLLGLGLAVVTGVATAPEVFSGFASPTIFLFVGSFLIARAATLHRLDRRFALWVLSRPGVASSTRRIVVAIGGTAALLSSVISNTAAVAMLLPIALGVLGAVDELTPPADGATTRPRLSAALLLMTAYGASIGGLLTPIGSPPNLIGRGFITELLGQEIGFLRWMGLAAPIVVCMFVLLCVVLLLLNRPEVGALPGAEQHFRAASAACGRLSRAERNTLIAFGSAVVFWVLPGVLQLLPLDDASGWSTAAGRLDEGTVAILAASLLFLLPGEGGSRAVLTWSEAVRIDWGTIVLFGSGIALGSLLSSTGLAARVGTSLAGSLGTTSLLAVTLGAVVAAVLLSEAASNTAAVGVIVPVVIPVAQAAGIDPLVPALGATFGASFGFMLPVSTPPNAIVYGSGRLPLLRMVRSGAVVDVTGIVVITASLLLLLG